jgi:hypothetical protein
MRFAGSEQFGARDASRRNALKYIQYLRAEVCATRCLSVWRLREVFKRSASQFVSHPPRHGLDLVRVAHQASNPSQVSNPFQRLVVTASIAAAEGDGG